MVGTATRAAEFETTYAEELEERYGNRVRSRMRELFNLIAFDTKAGDKRKWIYIKNRT